MADRRTAERPNDVIDGPDPGVAAEYERVTAWRAVCACGYSCTDDGHGHAEARRRMDEHLKWAHPAYRNADITCQASPPWDHKRWCVRPKNHDGDHWTPSFNGGVGWSTGPRDSGSKETK